MLGIQQETESLDFDRNSHPHVIVAVRKANIKSNKHATYVLLHLVGSQQLYRTPTVKRSDNPNYGNKQFAFRTSQTADELLIVEMMAVEEGREDYSIGKKRRVFVIFDLMFWCHRLTVVCIQTEIEHIYY